MSIATFWILFVLLLIGILVVAYVDDRHRREILKEIKNLDYEIRELKMKEDRMMFLREREKDKSEAKLDALLNHLNLHIVYYNKPSEEGFEVKKGKVK